MVYNSVKTVSLADWHDDMILPCALLRICLFSPIEMHFLFTACFVTTGRKSGKRVNVNTLSSDEK